MGGGGAEKSGMGARDAPELPAEPRLPQAPPAPKADSGAPLKPPPIANSPARPPSPASPAALAAEMLDAPHSRPAPDDNGNRGAPAKVDAASGGTDCEDAGGGASGGGSGGGGVLDEEAREAPTAAAAGAAAAAEAAGAATATESGPTGTDAVEEEAASAETTGNPPVTAAKPDGFTGAGKAANQSDPPSGVPSAEGAEGIVASKRACLPGRTSGLKARAVQLNCGAGSQRKHGPVSADAANKPRSGNCHSSTHPASSAQQRNSGNAGLHCMSAQGPLAARRT